MTYAQIQETGFHKIVWMPLCTLLRKGKRQNSLDAIMHIVKERKETLTDNVLDKLVEMFKEQHK
jgi:hypothetical protein